MIPPNAATTGSQHPIGVASASHNVHFIGIRSSPARSLTIHPSSDYRRRLPSVDSSLGTGVFKRERRPVKFASLTLNSYRDSSFC